MSENSIQTDNEQKERIIDRHPGIIFLCISAVFFLAVIGFFVWHTVRMLNFERNYEIVQGTIVDIVEETSVSSDGIVDSYYYVIAYTYDGKDYKFTDTDGHKSYSVHGKIGKPIEIFVDPNNPSHTESVAASDNISIISACFFAFFCVTYAAGMFIECADRPRRVRLTFKQRVLRVWGTEVLLCVVFLLLFWIGLPNSGFGTVFTRIDGAVGVTVICGLILLATSIDGIVTYKLRSYK